ncbi:hypothetical protein NB550_12050 [Vibrio parahaemolyticus]|jgi:hypothetical protein|uniref:hypothetical protein n=1 Tax=Vibrio parahaemolyticus TaxID=670 RepID=UPI0011106C6F|nr:hypothetical protein [Vibrio parahaemolyticus]MCR9888012.1 hypothetical protein [Vibrio parahaemolyticus]MCR9918226.1 hypothetical protein [Vibrio parahaemolyticus]MEA5230295.1 hypothetical protein [Vibrio parahaemolyticus]TMX39575.1 hypothetical protein DA098_09815 [Vibrio parahaemolyticus]TMX80358.1 hypothetical protein DA094_02160 [Vibrio parahaemolyticus]
MKKTGELLLKFKAVFTTLFLTTLPSIAFASEEVQGFETYGNKILSGFTYVAGAILFAAFIWGLIKFTTAMFKIPELRDNSNDREAKQKILLNMGGGLAAMVAPLAIVAFLISFFGTGMIKFQLSEDNENADSLGVINQLKETSQ